MFKQACGTETFVYEGRDSLYSHVIVRAVLFRYKDNFVNLEQLVLVGGPDDGTIIPWQSAHYGFYDENLNIVPFYEQPTYLNDSYGMRTINEAEKLVIKLIPGVVHAQWILNRTVYEEAIKPYLV